MKSMLVEQITILLPSPPSRGAWIEIMIERPSERCAMSPPSRGAWIEIPCILESPALVNVAPLAGGVD